MELVEKVRIDIGVSESFVERTISALAGAARTGEVGDGKIFVTPVERVVRIRTGEQDQAAVTPALAAAVSWPRPGRGLLGSGAGDWSSSGSRGYHPTPGAREGVGSYPMTRAPGLRVWVG
jgi:hypothetical protein